MFWVCDQRSIENTPVLAMAELAKHLHVVLIVYCAVMLYSDLLYFFLQEYVYPDARDRQYLLFFHKGAKKTRFDLEKYNQLKDAIAQVTRVFSRNKANYCLLVLHLLLIDAPPIRMDVS